MKEDIKSKDGKRKLYFSLDMQNFITYVLDPKTTCKTILEKNKTSIESKISQLYKNKKIDLTFFDFFLIDLKEIKKSQGNFLPKIKLDNNIYIYNFLQNPKTILCFMEKIPINLEQKININIEDKLKTENKKFEEMKIKYLNDKQIDNFFVNKTIFIYDYKAKIYNKFKGNLSEKQFTIHGKTESIIYIQDILSISYCDIKNPIISTLVVKSGYNPPFYIILKSEENQWIIGLKTEEKLKKWKNGFDFVLINLNFFINDIDFNIKINNLKNSISQKESQIIKGPLTIDNLVNDKFRKIIFYKNIKDIKILQLVEDVLIYKKMILSENYNKAKEKFLEIFNNNKEENKKKRTNVGKIITIEKVDEYSSIIEKLKEIKEEDIDKLKELLKPDLFDNIFEEINKQYIDPFLNKFNKELSEYKAIEENDDEKNNAKKNMESLIAYNCFKFYKIENLDSFLDL